MLLLYRIIFEIFKLELMLRTNTCLKSSCPTTPGIFEYLLYNLHETKDEKKFYPSIDDFFKQSN